MRRFGPGLGGIGGITRAATARRARNIPLPASAGSRRVAVAAYQFIAGSTDRFFGHSIPLPRGYLTPTQLAAGFGRLVLGGTEVAIYTEPLLGPGVAHDDGSLRVVYVQGTLPAGVAPTVGSPVVGEFRCDEPRTLAPPAFVDPTPYLNSPAATGTGPNGATNVLYDQLYVVPNAVLPVNARDICDSGLFGPVRPRGENPASGPAATFVARYDAMWDQYEPTLAGRWNGTNSRAWYYDRLLTYCGAWARTGNPVYFQRGWAQYARIRTVYYAPNVFGTNEYDIGIKGWALAYWLFRDTAARIGIRRLAALVMPPNTTIIDYGLLGNGNTTSMGERKASNYLRATVFHQQTGLTDDGFGHTVTDATRLNVLQRFLNDPAGGPLKTVPSWGPVLNERTGVTVALTSRQKVDNVPTDKTVTLPFQTGLEVDSLMEWYDRVEPRDDVKAAIATLVDNWWTHFRVDPPVGAARGIKFQFASAAYDNQDPSNPISGGTGPSADLNGFYLRGFYWCARVFLDPTYLDRGDQVLDAHTRAPYDGVVGPFISGGDQSPKQFAEVFQFMGEGLGERARAVAALRAAGYDVV